MTISRALASYPLHRVLVAVISFGAVLIGARLLSADVFSTLITTAFIAKFLRILNLGATAGYFVSRYSDECPLVTENLAGERSYLTYFSVQMAGLAAIVLIFSIIWLPEYFPGAIAFLLLIPLFIFEPIVRYRRNFSFSLLPDMVLSVALLSVVVAQFIGGTQAGYVRLYLSLLAVLSVAVVLFALRRYVTHSSIGSEGLSFHGYLRIVTLGGPLYLGSALYLLGSSMDRLVLPLYGSSDQVGTYFLAHQLTVGSMIFSTSINFVNTVNMGEARKKDAGVDSDFLKRKLGSAALVALGSYLALMAGTIVLEQFLLPDRFEGLALVTLFIGAGLACFFMSNSITPIIAYYRRQMPLLASMGVVATVLVANTAIAYSYKLGPLWLAGGAAIALSAQAAFAIWLTFDTVRRKA